MISSEVQRTLVKSPPELWTELSNPASLARHLGALGEIRITRAVAEKRVDWEAERTTGSIQIKPSGWGTKVTLSVTREFVPEDLAAGGEVGRQGSDAPPPAQPEAVSEPEVVATSTATAVDEAGLEVVRVDETVATAAVIEATDESDLEAMPATEMLATSPEARTTSETGTTDASTDETEPRRGFFARLFGRRRRPAAGVGGDQPDGSGTLDIAPTPAAATDGDTREPLPGSAIASLQARFQPEPLVERAALADPVATEPTPQPNSHPGATEPTPQPNSHPVATEPTPQPNSHPVAAEPVDVAAELRAAEEVAAAQVTALLTAVLDRLGAAHHRPFSRA